MYCLNCGKDIEEDILCEECKAKGYYVDDDCVLQFKGKEENKTAEKANNSDWQEEPVVENESAVKTQFNGASEFNGSFWGYLWINLQTFLMIFFSLGIATSKAIRKRHVYMCAHTRLNGRQLIFDEKEYEEDYQKTKLLRSAIKGYNINIIMQLIMVVCLMFMMLWFFPYMMGQGGEQSTMLLVALTIFRICAILVFAMYPVEVLKTIACCNNFFKTYIHIEGGKRKLGSGFYEDNKFMGGKRGKKYGNLLWGCVLFSVATCGIGYPISVYWMVKYNVNHTVYDGRKLNNGSSVGSFYGKIILYNLLTYITFGIFGLFVGLKMQKWITSNTSLSEVETKFSPMLLEQIPIGSALRNQPKKKNDQ